MIRRPPVDDEDFRGGEAIGGEHEAALRHLVGLAGSAEDGAGSDLPAVGFGVPPHRRLDGTGPRPC